MTKKRPAKRAKKRTKRKPSVAPALPNNRKMTDAECVEYGKKNPGILYFCTLREARRFFPERFPTPENQTLIVAPAPRVIPPSAKVWDRGATFEGWELDTIQQLAQRVKQKKHVGGLAGTTLSILERKKI